MQYESLQDFDALRREIRHFLDDEPFDRVGFVRLVKILRGFPIRERIVAYEYLLNETVRATDHDRQGRRQALERIADLVGREPPEIVGVISPALRAVS